MSRRLRGALQRVREGREHGASAVELALVSLLLFALLFGIIDFGILFGQQLALNNGVRQGARSAVVAGNTAAQQCGQIRPAVLAATGPAIGMWTEPTTPSDPDTPTVSVVAKRVASADTTQVRLTCGSGNASVRVCEGSARPDGSTDSLLVQASYPAKFVLPIPFPGLNPTFDLTATSVYRCEYS
jgi:Flp pilus assembly protein TadG